MVTANGGTILIIEDDAGVARLQQRRLERSGYRTVSAGTAEGGMHKLTEGGVELVLLDYRLPGDRNGLDVFGEMKAAGLDVPVIIVTGFSDEATVIKALRAGVRDFVTKSLEYLDYLPEAIERVLKQVRIEQQLAHSQARLAGIINSARDAILTVDADRRITLFNPAAEQIFECNAADALGQPVEVFISTTIDSPTNLFGPAADETRLRAAWFELRGLRSDGAEFPLEASISSAAVAGSKFYIVIIRDVSEKKKLEAQFLRAQRMDCIGTLAGGIAHDLNNVLAPILMGAELLQGSKAHIHDDGLLETIRVSAERGADLVRQVLMFARGVEGQRVPVEAPHLVKGVVKLVGPTLPKTITLETSFAPNCWVVTGDTTQLTQVLMNLCVNARDAMPRGGKLTIAVENVVLKEGVTGVCGAIDPGAYLLLKVADTGAGIRPEVLDKIFDPFFTTKEVGKGTGLGLSTVLGIVRSHGGAVNVQSTVGKGTEFFVYLRANTAETTGHEATPSLDLPGGGEERILLVDDEPFICQVTKSTLEGAGYEVLVASDGTEALAQYLKHRGRIDLVVTDMMMAIMDGPAMIRTLKQIDPGVRVIAVTGSRPAGGPSEAPGVGERAFLEKPYTAATLLKTVRAVLDHPEPATALCRA